MNKKGKNTPAQKNSKKTESVPLIPLRDWVLIKEEMHNVGEEKTLSGIIIPASGDKNESTKRGKVVAIGEGKVEDGKKIPVSVSVGDVVIYQWGDKMKIDGEEFTLVKDSEIIAKAK